MQTEKTMTPPTVSQMVKDDYRIADVLKKWGINYCCGGNLPLEEVCAIKNVDLTALQTELKKATNTVTLPNALQFNEWPVIFLVDYIIHVHHLYLEQSIPALSQTLSSFVSGHVKKYPYLTGVNEAFQNLSATVSQNCQIEEESIFPYVKQISNTHDRKEAYGPLFVRTMRKPLAETVSKEKTRVGNLLLQLREQTNNYRFSEGACTNHQVIYHKLKEFDNDLVQHIHLENNILYPKVLQMEKALLQL